VASNQYNAPVYAIGPTDKIYKVTPDGKTSSFPIKGAQIVRDTIKTKGGL
jgi:hypothetical protein